jgi:predicted RNA methylase
MQERLKFLTDITLSDTSYWKQKRDCFLEMHQLFVTLGALDAYMPDSKEDDLWLANGCAVSPKSAAMCLLEIARTQKFVAGLKLAITDRLAATQQRPIHILDAGAGPYAIFSILTALYFSPNEVQYTALDIHPQNIASVEKLVAALGMQNYFTNIAVQDLIVYQWPKDKSLDIVITETMKNALNKETQVAITLNLNKQLNSDGIFIPQNIVLSLQQVDIQKRKALLYNPDLTEVDYTIFEKKITAILELNQTTTEAYMAMHPICTTTIPNDFTNDSYYLNINTSIQVYKHIELKHKETSITAPLTISGPTNAALHAGDGLSFYYENSAHPGLRFTILNKAAS